MGLPRWLSWLGRGAAVTAGFAGSAPKPIDQMFAEMRHLSGRVTRDEALTVPAMIKARNMICSAATLPLDQLDGRNRRVRSSLLEQIDPDVANVVTLAQTFEDLIFEGIAWWRITGFGSDMFPMTARRVDPVTVSLDPPLGVYRSPAPLPGGVDPRGAVVWMDGKEVPADEVIRFDSPNPAVLKVAGRSIRRAIKFEETAETYASDPRPLDYFSPAEGAAPIDDDEVATILDKWRNWRRKRSTGYVPASLKYNSVDSPTPADLQLAELKEQATLDIANALGVEPEDLGVSTTSRTYTNAVDRRRDRINDVLSPYMRAITDRLSMGDVTKRGYRVVFNLDDYMKSNPTERWAYYKTARELEVLSINEIRDKEGEPERDEPATEPAPAPVPAAVDAHRREVVLQFDGSKRVHFANITVHEFSVDKETRTITGVALPYNKAANGFRFERGALQFGEPSRVKLLRDHDFKQPLGHAMGLNDSPQGFRVRFKVARGAEGDRALELAEDKVLDGLSVGVDFDLAADTVPDPKNKAGLLVRRADLREVSLTAMPAFDDARVTKVAASWNGGNTMQCVTCSTEHAPTVACPTQQQPAQQQQQQPAQQPAQFNLPAGLLQLLATAQQPPAQQPVQQQPPALQLSLEQLSLLSNLYAGHNGNLHLPLTPDVPEQRQAVDPTRVTASTSVKEKEPYRFDRKGNMQRGTHDFSQDLFKGLSGGDGAAYERALSFVRKQFDVVSTDVNDLNPTRNRPDMYVDQRDFEYPVWEAINKGTLTDITPFTFPKFSSASGLVGNHTEGTEPSSGTFVSTNQTVTPTPVSGKAKISRETWDQGGNPQVSNLIWQQMLKGWFEALEAAAVALLDAATPTAIALTAGGGTTGQTLDAEITAAFAALQFVRGGFRMNKGYGQIDLYKALVAAKDTTGRRLYPGIGPQNALGTVAQRFAAIDVNGVTLLPAWALAATGSVVASSYIFDDRDAHGWASAPTKLDITMTEVANVYIGIWGYKATAISDITGVREITYDPVP